MDKFFKIMQAVLFVAMIYVVIDYLYLSRLLQFPLNTIIIDEPGLLSIDVGKNIFNHIFWFFVLLLGVMYLKKILNKKGLK